MALQQELCSWVGSSETPHIRSTVGLVTVGCPLPTPSLRQFPGRESAESLQQQDSRHGDPEASVLSRGFGDAPQPHPASRDKVQTRA